MSEIIRSHTSPMFCNLPVHYLLLILFVLFTGGCKKQREAEFVAGAFEKELDIGKFKNPPAEYRSFPFYSLNDSLTEKEITQQILDFEEAGFGGFYLHSRSGLITGFLGNDWWRIMDAAVDAAKCAGLHAMFYDEDKWPSGYAGGMIPKMNESYRAKSLARLEKTVPIPRGGEMIHTDSLYNYIVYTARFGYEVFNGTCYVDLFNPEMVREFIDVAYRPYVEKYSTRITGYRTGIFSDEPHIHARYFDRDTPHRGVLSWSPWLEKRFTESYGYPLRDKIPLLFEEKGNWRQVRMHYYRAKALQFEDSFTKQIAAFCQDNGMIFTGHFLGEDVLEKVRDRIGNSMLHYRNMQQPGIDHLGLSIENRLITAKRLSSVANQCALPKRLSELFGISGHNMNFQDRKWIGGWHTILGINHFCPHLTQYSLVGARKRDYPPTFSYHQPYWKYNKKIEEYLARIAYATTLGHYHPQLLIISPLESEYIKSHEEGEFTSGILTLMETLQKLHYDYDIGDEQIMADTAVITREGLCIGAMTYKNVILPDRISLRETTIDLLQKLVQNGGLIFTTGRFPTFVDGLPGGEKLRELKNSVIHTDRRNLPGLLNEKVKALVTVEGEKADKIWTQVRSVPDGHLIQISNISNTDEIRFRIQSGLLTQDVVWWDPSLGKCFRLAPNSQGEFELALAPASNSWITCGSLSSQAKGSGIYSLPENTSTVWVLDEKWQGKRLDPNAITLDFASYSTDNGKTFSAPEPVIGIFNRLSNEKYSGSLILKYSVSINTLPSGCNLVVEQPEMVTHITVNDHTVAFNAEEFYIDHTFHTTEVTGFLTEGKNEIQLSFDFIPPRPLSEIPRERYGTEIESIYLTGDFAVMGNGMTETMETQRNQTGDFLNRPVYQFNGFSLTSEKESYTGNLTVEGYPFYAGAFELKQDFDLKTIDPSKKYYLELPDCESVVSVIEINGRIADTLCWAPYRTEITGFLKEGGNEVKITLVNSLRNLLGPHHHRGGELIKVGPNSFTGAGGFPDGRGESDWYDLRKTEAELAIWTDTYHHIPFGFLTPVVITSNDKSSK
jgi:hypothetical protein